MKYGVPWRGSIYWMGDKVFGRTAPCLKRTCLATDNKRVLDQRGSVAAWLRVWRWRRLRGFLYYLYVLWYECRVWYHTRTSADQARTTSRRSRGRAHTYPPGRDSKRLAEVGSGILVAVASVRVFPRDRQASQLSDLNLLCNYRPQFFVSPLKLAIV